MRERKLEIFLSIPWEMPDLAFSPVDLDLRAFGKLNEGYTRAFGNRTDFFKDFLSNYYGFSKSFNILGKHLIIFARHVCSHLETSQIYSNKNIYFNKIILKIFT